jgi:transposase
MIYPYCMTQLEKCRVSTILDHHFKDHGHWNGISGGQVAVGWLLYILSESDHRLSHVESWAELRLRSLSALLKEPQLRSVDFCDDRLGRLLDRYSNDEQWNHFEQDFGKNLLQVYQLRSSDSIQVVRTDSFNAPQFRKKGGLFQHGYSKQRRADQPFCKVMMSSLDPMSIPLAVDILKGSGPDVDHYLPIIRRVQSMLEQKGHLYVGDAQLGSLPNRSAIHLAGDYYLCPLGRKQVSQAKRDDYLSSLHLDPLDLPGIYTDNASERKAAHFYEIEEQVSPPNSWVERRILVYSPDYAAGLIQSFTNRMNEAEEKIQNLVRPKKGRRLPKTLKELNIRIDALLKRYQVEECFEIQSAQHVQKKQVRKYKDRQEQIQQHITLQLSIKRNESAIEKRKKGLGWQIYGTNVPKELLTTAELVSKYRDEYKIEHLFNRLINKEIGLLPIYLKREERVKGLIRLLSVALRIAVLIQHQVRKQLAMNKEELNEIYPGNKSRSTQRPTTAMMLAVFRGISVVWMQTTESSILQMTPLKNNQKRIIKLIGLPDPYERLLHILQTHSSLRET